MKIEVWVKASAKQVWIHERQDRVYDISVKEKPKDGKANEAVIAVLAAHFNVAKRDVVLLRGESSRRKQFQINSQKAKTSKKKADAEAWRNA
jgi:uncharacterized protein